MSVSDATQKTLYSNSGTLYKFKLAATIVVLGKEHLNTQNNNTNLDQYKMKHYK